MIHIYIFQGILPDVKRKEIDMRQHEMDLEDITLSEIKQTQKDKCHMITLTEVPRAIKFTETKQNGSCQGLGGWESEEPLFNGYKVSVLQDEKVPETSCTTM